MTRQTNDNVLEAAMELLNENGFEAYSQVLRILLNEAMKLERLNEEVKRRTRVAGLFPNEASLLRLAGAILMETDEDWQTVKRYLNMNVENSDLASDRTKIYRKAVA
jgi:transposase-like protein